MDDMTRDAVLQLLGNAMSDISEECWYAGWVGGAEYHIPGLCRRAVETGRPQPWGHGAVTSEAALGLAYLAEQLGCWANWDRVRAAYGPHRPFPVPAEHLAALDRQPAYRPARCPRNRTLGKLSV